MENKNTYDPPMRGALTLKGGAGMCRPQDPLSTTHHPDLFQATFQLLKPHFWFWKKILHFQDQFLLNFSSWDTNFSQNLFQRPQLTLVPTSENLSGTYPSKFLLTTPREIWINVSYFPLHFLTHFSPTRKLPERPWLSHSPPLNKMTAPWQLKFVIFDFPHLLSRRDETKKFPGNPSTPSAGSVVVFLQAGHITELSFAAITWVPFFETDPTECMQTL